MLFITILRLLVLLLSGMGFCLRLEKRSGVHAAYLPMLVMSGQICLLFLAGLLNLLLPVTLLLLVLGLALLVHSLRTEGRECLRLFVCPALGMFALMALLLFAAVQGQRLAINDDFSHWGLIVRQMLLNDRYPNFMDTILFQAYPPAGATWVYYVARLAGGGEEIWIFAQSLLYLAFLLPLLRFYEKGRGAVLVYVFALMNLALVYIIPVQSGLCVDGLLAAAGFGGLVYVWDHCRDGEEASGVRLLCCVPLLAVCILIKNSGLLFAVLGSCLLLKRALDRGTEKKQRRLLLIAAVLPYLSLLLWQRHCALVFENAAATKHALSVDYMQYMFRQKDGEYLFWLAKRLLLFAAESRELWLLLSLLLGTWLLLRLSAPEKCRDYGKLLLACGVFYLLYLAGMYLVYVFSMSEQQGHVLASAQRYQRTALLTILLWAGCFAAHALSSDGRKGRGGTAAAVLAVLMLLGLWRLDFGRFPSIWDRYSSPVRAELEQLLREYPLPRGESFLIVNEKTVETGTELFLGPYLTLTKEVMMLVEPTAEQMNDSVKAYQHLVILDMENSAVQDWVAREYPEQLGLPVIDLWRGEDAPPPEAAGYPRLSNFVSKLY